MERFLNKIICGDSYNLIKELPDKSIDLIITDPPYEFETNGGGWRKNNKYVKVYNEIKDHNLNKGINYNLLNEYLRVMKKPNIYIWCNKAQILDYMNFFVKDHHCKFNIIIWHKTNAPPLCGSKYLSDCEYCIYFFDGVKLNTTYETASQVYTQPINARDRKIYSHPTIKPINIINNLIINSSNKGDIILDTFMGSGTTAIACKQLDRQFIGFEIEQKYVDIANNRLKGIDQNGQLSMFIE